MMPFPENNGPTAQAFNYLRPKPPKKQAPFLRLDTHWAENAWIWAIDPEYNQGHLRGRLQKPITLCCTHWHADELYMEDLWRTAQKKLTINLLLSER